MLFRWLWGGTLVFVAAQEIPAPVPAVPAPRAVQRGEVPADSDVHAALLWKLIAQLDDPDFGVRNDASRQLANAQRDVIPLLVAALDDESREVRFRTHALLAQSFAFDDLAAPLLAAIPQPQGVVARTILRDRALEQIAVEGELPAAKLLFELWGTNAEELRRHVLFNILVAPGEAEVRQIVQPLVGMHAKVTRFQDLLARLESLSLRYEHRQGPGYVIARALAQGLREQNDVSIEFAVRYVSAFEVLAHDLEQRGMSPAAIRKEIADRASMSDGAVAYVAQRLGSDPAGGPQGTARVKVTPATLADELFRGLAASDAKDCYRCVGKVHIVDMLDETLRRWPDAPHDGVVPLLIEAVEATVATGDKPKALVLLDALEACRQLTLHQLDCRPGVGEPLARRLYLAAIVAPNSRAFHPVRSVHDRFVQLLARGVVVEHAAFPGRYFDRYLRGESVALADESRSALGQYVALVEQLLEARVELNEPGATQFLSLLQEHLLTGPRELVTQGTQEATRLLRARVDEGPPAETSPTLDQSLATWVNQWRTGR